MLFSKLPFRGFGRGSGAKELFITSIKAGIIRKAVFLGGLGCRQSRPDILVGVEQLFFNDEFVKRYAKIGLEGVHDA